MAWSEVPKNAYLFLRGLKNWQQFILGLMLSSTLLYFVGQGSIDAYIKHQSELELEKLKSEERNKARRDSINFKDAQIFWEKSIQDELAIRSICDNMEDFFVDATQISLLKLHDHGDVLAPENNPRNTVKWSTLNKITDSYQNEPVYTGALWAMNEADEKGFIYIPLLEAEPNYWRGREKAFHEEIGSKSTAFIHIKDIKKNSTLISKWFIVIHWDKESPYNNPYSLRIQLERFKRLLEPKIYIAPERLRTD